jgi:flagellar motor protein MotB
MQSNAPVPAGQPGPPGQPPQGGAPQDAKSAKQKKKEEAEKLKKQQQEKRKQLELSVQVNSFTKALSNSVMDIPSMFRFASNTLKTMLMVDHVAIASFEEWPQVRAGILCVGKAESILPKVAKPAAPAAPKPKEKKEEVKKKEDEDKEPDKPVPTFPVAPKEPLKPGTLPHLENIIWDMPLLYKIRDVKQPAMIPDAAKFPDPEVNKFAAVYGIKSILFIPLMNTKEDGTEEVTGVCACISVNEPKVLSQMEVTFAQKTVQGLGKSIETAPPDLPANIKKVITAISKDEASDKLMDYYSSMLDDIFDLLIYEIGVEKMPEKFMKLMEEKAKIEEDSKLKKIWFQINELVKADGEFGSIARRAIQEAYAQADEFTRSKKANMPIGFKGLNNFMKKNIKYNELANLGLEQEVILGLEDQIDNALRGKALFTDKEKASLINDVEQSNMLMNYISAPASLDFRNHIKAAIEEADCPEEVEKELLLTDMCYYGIAEISKSVCQDLVEKVLFEIPEYLEQPQDKQAEQTEALVSHLHRKIMANLVTGLKGKKSVWINFISAEIKQKAKDAAKKRAVLVGRIKNEEQEEEDY